jgi:hypothetical protein
MNDLEMLTREQDCVCTYEQQEGIDSYTCDICMIRRCLNEIREILRYYFRDIER